MVSVVLNEKVIFKHKCEGCKESIHEVIGGKTILAYQMEGLGSMEVL